MIRFAKLRKELVLYYASAGVVSLVMAVMSGEAASLRVLGARTPLPACFVGDTFAKASPRIFVGLILQAAAILLLQQQITARLSRPAKAAVWAG